MWKTIGGVVWAILLMLFCVWFVASFGLALIKAIVVLLGAMLLFAGIVLIAAVFSAATKTKE